MVEIRRSSTGLAGADRYLLRALAGKWLGWSVSEACVLPPCRDQTMPISGPAAHELPQLLAPIAKSAQPSAVVTAKAAWNG